MHTCGASLSVVLGAHLQVAINTLTIGSALAVALAVPKAAEKVRARDAFAKPHTRTASSTTEHQYPMYIHQHCIA